MFQILVAPDSFKGTLTSIEICEIVKEIFQNELPQVSVKTFPIADGGEGTSDVFLYHAGGEKRNVEVTGPNFAKVMASYVVLKDKIAVIDMASASGLPLMKGKLDALGATTYGTGELILDALNQGCQHFYLGLGGSATNDVGIGAFSALGIRFLDESGNAITPNGKGLIRLTDIDITQMDNRLKESRFTILTDVRNPLYGENGAAHVFGGQKGATQEEILLLNKAMKNFAELVKRKFNIECASIEGAGAAGGFGAGIAAFLNAKYVSGIAFLLEHFGFQEHVKASQLVITGEGKLDCQTTSGKAIQGVIEASAQTPVIAVCGISTLAKMQEKTLGLKQVFETNPNHFPFESIQHNARQDFITTLHQIMHWLQNEESLSLATK